MKSKYIKLFEDYTNENFWKWFGDSKVVDNAGKPLVVYHGSQTHFNEFNNVAYFTDDWYNADGYGNGENVYEVYLSIKNPLIINAKGKKWDKLKSPYGTSTRNIVASIDRKKYDGVIFHNIKDNWNDDEDYQDPSTVYVTFYPNQIKSAEYNNGNFDVNKSLINENKS